MPRTSIYDENFVIRPGTVVDGTGDLIAVEINDRGGSFVEGPTDRHPTLTNRGVIRILSSHQNAIDVPLTGVNVHDYLGGWYTSSFIHNAVGGLIDVVSTDPWRDARGVFMPGRFPSLINDGHLRVVGARDAMGIESWGTTTIENTGLISVEAARLARGVTIYNGGTFVNSGRVEVVGNAESYGVLNQGPGVQIQNHGLIQVRDAQGQATGVGVRLSDGVYASHFVNTGVVNATVAVAEWLSNRTPLPLGDDWITNSGELRGDVIFTFGHDRVDNSGLIDGDVTFVDGIDMFLGAAGRLLGTLTMGGGDDHAFSGFADDVVLGGVGNDDLHGGAGADDIDGGDGIDFLYGDEGADVLRGGAGRDSLLGGAGDDVLHAQDGDFLDGGTGDDRLYLSAGADVLIFGANVGADEVTGFNVQEDRFGLSGGLFLSAEVVGSDTRLTHAGGTVLVKGVNTLSLGQWNALTVGSGTLGSGGGTLTGSTDADALNGGAGADVLIGGEGDDLLSGQDGNDRLEGGLGADRLSGGAGDDVVHGGGDADVIWDLQGHNILEGGDGDDWILAGDGNDVLRGGAGQDQLTGGIGEDQLFGGDDNDTIWGGAGNDLLDGGGSDDDLRGGYGDDLIRGGDGHDFIHGGWGSDLIYGGEGDDDISGGETFLRDDEFDVIHGEGGNDRISVGYGGVIFGGSGNDMLGGGGAIWGEDGDDQLAGADFMDGGAGADVLGAAATGSRMFGGDGNDRLYGSIGADWLHGGAGDDWLFGDASPHIDWADYFDATSGVTIDLRINAASQDVGGGAGWDMLSGIEALNGSAHRDVLTGDVLGNVFRGNGGADVIDGREGNDTVILDGFAEADRITFGDGRDVLQFSAGAAAPATTGVVVVTDFVTGAVGDRIDLTAWLATLPGWTPGLNPFGSGHLRLIQSGTDTLLQADGNGGGDAWVTLVTFQNATAATFTAENLDGYPPDGSPVPGLTVTGTAHFDTLSGGHGDDVIIGLDNADLIRGGAGDDRLEGGDGPDTIHGDDGDDVLIGGNGHDDLLGGEGNDRITGGAGEDLMSAGSGDDVVVLDGFADADVVTLGTGRDTLLFQSGAMTPDGPGLTLVTDFVTGAGGDRLDLSGWLGNLTGLGGGANPFQTGHLRLLQAGAHTSLQVDQNGGGDAWTTLVTFENTTATAFTAENLGYAATPGPFQPATATTSAFGSSATNWDDQSRTLRTLADVNGDGRPDLVGFGRDGTWVSLTGADGVQGPARLAVRSYGSDALAGGWSSTETQPRHLADVNGDGRADVIAFGSKGAYVSLGRSDGTFSDPVLAIRTFGSDPGGGGWASQDVFPRLVADVNGDGRADVVGFGYSGTYVALGQADGTFGGVILAVNSYGRGPLGGGWSTQSQYPRQMADVNGDGRADVVAFGGSGVWVSLGQANGTFSAPEFAANSFGSSLQGGGWSTQVHPRLLADINGDGRDDLVGFGSRGVYAALADGSGRFGPVFLAINTFGSDAEGGGWSNPNAYVRVLQDVNGDGRADIVGFGASRVFVAFANVDGTFGQVTSLGSSVPNLSAFGPQSVDPRFAADLNGDGLADILIVTPDGVQISLANPTFFRPPAADDGAQTVPSDLDAWESKDAGPQVLPGLEDDGDLQSAEPQVLPGPDDAHLTLRSAGGGREWAGLAARRDGDLALEVPTFAADDFLPSELKSVGPQVLPAESGLDLDALFESSAADLALEQALDALSPAPVKPIVFDAEDALHHLPAHDAFQ